MSKPNTPPINTKDYIDMRLDHQDKIMDRNTALLAEKIDNLGARMDAFERHIDDKINVLTHLFNWKFYITLAFCIPIYLKLFAPEITALITK